MARIPGIALRQQQDALARETDEKERAIEESLPKSEYSCPHCDHKAKNKGILAIHVKRYHEKEEV